jgi:hypothetical protein
LLGVIASTVDDAGTIRDLLDRRGVEHILIGQHEWEFQKEVLSATYMPYNLSRLSKGRIRATTFVERLRERAIDTVVSGGTLGALLDSGTANRIRLWGPLQDLAFDRQKASAVRLTDALKIQGIRVPWLVEVAPEMSVGGTGSLNGIELQLSSEVQLAAIQRAQSAVARHRYAMCCIDDGPQCRLVTTPDTDRLLKNLASRPPPATTRLAIKVIGHPNPSPWDPPTMGLTTVMWAAQAHVKAILIDAQRGIITTRSQTLERAANAKIAVIGV